MKRVFILLGLLVALQLSAQNQDFKNNNDQQDQMGNQEQTGMPMPGQHQMRGKEMGMPEKANHRPPFFGQEGPGDYLMLPLDQLSDKDRETAEGYLKDFHKVLDQKENELFLKKAELRYLTHVEKPDINQIAGKLDEISQLESSIQLERIKFELKIKEQFPALGEGFKRGPRPQAPEAGAPASNDRPGKTPAKKK